MSSETFDPTVDPEVAGPLQAPEPTISTDGLRTEGAVRELPVEDFERSQSTFDIHEFIERRRANDRDVRIIWTGRNSGVGLGKTQGALSVAKAHYPEFDAEEHATLDSREAIHLLRTAPMGAALLLDEIGQIADARRTQQTESVELTQLLQMCRYRQYLLQATLPSVRALDIRLLDMADLRVHVTEQGQAKVFRYDIPDSDPTGEMIPKILQYLEWDPIDEDPDYQILNEMKEEVYEGMGESSFIHRDEHEQIVKETEEDAERETRNEILTNIYERTELTQKDIGNAIGLSRRRVGEIVNGE
ncbi:hypothetical protein AB7C87_17105 [Natrarchaeobius sp. A-rgal3]|uniref:hypothetical protein n=1 Tax=Natrarchaeobius versutus TaxID=1679078 RepID=UPI003510710B